jgi:hypothetical protein
VSVAVTLRHWPLSGGVSDAIAEPASHCSGLGGITEAELARTIADVAEVEEGPGILLKKRCFSAVHSSLSGIDCQPVVGDAPKL